MAAPPTLLYAYRDESNSAPTTLLKLFEPEMNDRAWYCLQQNPVVKQRLLSGKFDPAESLHCEIRRLQEKL